MCKLAVMDALAFMVVVLRIVYHLLQLDKAKHPFSKIKVSFNPSDNFVEIIYISAGEAHCGAVEANGSVFLWGNNVHGECGQPP